MNKIAVVSPYFGQVPSHFSKWLMSAGRNSNITFIIIGDVNVEYKVPKNVKFIKYKFSDIQLRIKKMFGNNAVIDKPYKLADYRPAFGLLFEELFKHYEFWGYVDLDTILGNFSNFLSDEKLLKFDKLGMRGHFSIYKNIPSVNRAFLNKEIVKNTIIYPKAFFNKGAFHFDEDWGMGTRFLKQHFKVDTLLSPVPCMADISPKIFEFNPIRREVEDTVYIWEHGNLYETTIGNIESRTREVMYVHFQKRSIKDFSVGNSDSFIVSPNGIFELNSSMLSDLASKRLPTKWPEGNFIHYCHYYYNVVKSGEMKARIYKWTQK